MLEAIVIVLLSLFFLYVLYSLFFFLFQALINLILIILAGYYIKENYYKHKYIFLVCGFLGLFIALLTNKFFLWKITTLLVVAGLSAMLVSYLMEKYR